MKNYQKKHYEQIAKLLKGLNAKTESSSYMDGKIALVDVDKAFIKLFSEDSKDSPDFNKFNEDKFLKAIGYDKEEIAVMHYYGRKQ